MTVARYVGFANESEYNQHVAPPAAQLHVDIASASLDAPGDTQMFYGGGLQRSARLHRPGFYAPSGNIVYAFDIKTIGFLLAWALGGYNFTAGVAPANEIQSLGLGGATGGTFTLSDGVTTTPNIPFDATASYIQNELTQIYGGGMVSVTEGAGTFSIEFDLAVATSDLTADFSLLTGALSPALTVSQAYLAGTLTDHYFYGSADNILPSFCARVGKDHFEHVFHGCVIDSLEIQVEGEFTMATAEIVAARDSKSTLKEIQELLLPKEYPMAFYEVTATKGTDISAKVKSISISISNSQDAESGRGLGSRHPYRVVAGERETTLSKVMFYENSGPLEELWGDPAGVTPTGPAPFLFELNFDSGVHGSMKMVFPQVIYTTVAQQPSGRDEIEQNIDARAVLGTPIAVGSDLDVSTELYVELHNFHTASYLAIV